MPSGSCVKPLLPQHGGELAHARDWNQGRREGLSIAPLWRKPGPTTLDEIFRVHPYRAFQPCQMQSSHLDDC